VLLAMGNWLSDKYAEGTIGRRFYAGCQNVDTVEAIAVEHAKTPAQVMLRWHLQQGRSAIPKSTNPGRIAENFNVFDFELTEAQMADIDALDTGARSGPDPDIPRPEVFDWAIPEN